MASRLELQHDLEEIMASRNVYFNPPASLMMQYPCIRYSISTIDSKKADDTSYIRTRAYNLILIDRTPDSIYIDPILEMPHCRFGQHYVADNLHHYTFTLYY